MTNEDKVLIKSILDMNLSTYDTAISVAEAIKKTTEQQILEKACEWLISNANDYIINDKQDDGRDWLKIKSEMFEDFKKAMED